jgi:drug/metabolite transporter (DMT)-like permease
MNALFICLLASCFGSLSNLFFRKNSASNSTQNGYLLVYYLVTFVFSFALFPSIWETAFSFKMTCIGALAGILNVAMMLLTAKALKNGPAGLTFAFQNVSSIFPGLLLFLFFGAEFGFTFSSLQALGLCLVVIGLFLGAITKENSANPTARLTWLTYALGCLAVQILVLSIMQWRCLLFDPEKPAHLLIPFTLKEDTDVWFMPGQFGISFLIQAVLFLFDKRTFQRTELRYGALGGIANCLSTALLLLSTKLALPVEQPILFPCFAVSTIILCNIWAYKLYNEKFNITANTTCSLGILIGALS